MPYYLVGDLIKKLRTQKGISLEDLSDGILDKGNLSRIESGMQVPQKDKLDSLLQRLGIDTQETCEYYLNEREYEIASKCDLLKSLIANSKNSEADILLEELAKQPEFVEATSDGKNDEAKKQIKKQFLLSCRAAMMVNLEKDNEEIRKITVQALKITIPTYLDKYIPEYYLSDQEARLINILAITYSEENLEKTIKLLEDLKESLDSKRVDEKQKSRILTLILYNLSKYYSLAKKYLEAVKICNYGMNICKETGIYTNFPGIIYNKAYCLFELGYKGEYEHLIYQAYYMFDAMERDKEKDIIKNYAKEHMGIAINEK
ncbi:MAG: helix-turn-helix domain-containing protein [Oscillospiraceae bacterium]|nr:helix-turn-helix domain-containing protein [Oscillospiraceae bacterium]